MVSILSITNDRYQLDRRILNEADSLAQRGAVVTLWPLEADVVLPRTLPKGVRIMSTRHVEPSGRLLSICKQLASRSSALKGFLQSWQTRLVDPARRMVTRVHEVEGQTFDLLFAHDLPVLPLALALRQRQGRGKVILDAHELYEEQFDCIPSKAARRYWRRVSEDFIPQCDGVMTVSERIAAELQQRHGLPAPPTVLRNACPFVPEVTKTGKLRDLYGLDEDRKIVLCQGGVVPGRSLEDLIDAAPHLTDKSIAIVFLGFGQEAYVAQLKRRVARLRAQGIAFLGEAVEPDRLLDYTCDADLGFVSNRGEGLNNTDGAPNRLFEYLQARVPVLSFEHNGVREILSRSKTGWVERWESPEELAHIIEGKLEEAARMPRDRLDAAALEFSWEREEPKLLALVDQVMNAG